MTRVLLLVAFSLLAFVSMAGGMERASSTGVADIIVDDSVNPCAPGGQAFMSITAAVDSVTTPGKTIFVCEGEYPEDAINLDVDSTTIIGPRATPEDDGNAHVTKSASSVSSFMFNVSADFVTVSGLEIDGDFPQSGSLAVIPFYSSPNASSTAFTDNLVRKGNAGDTVGFFGFGPEVKRNVLIDTSAGIRCECSFGTFEENTVNEVSQGGPGIQLTGVVNYVVSNHLVGSELLVAGGSSTIEGNDVTLPEVIQGTGVTVRGDSVTMSNNIVTGGAYALAIYPDLASSTSVTVTGNTFQNAYEGIFMRDTPGNAFDVTATIGGSPANANVFRNNTFVNLQLYDVPNDISAEYNDWGVCTLSDVEATIDHKPDNPALGTVDYDPFIAACPTPSPSPSPTPTVSPTPTSSPTPTASGSPSPTATPAGVLMRGDIDCNGFIRADDALELVVYSAEIPVPHSPECPDVGGMAVIVGSGGPFLWGNTDCDDNVDIDDFVALIEFIAEVLEPGTCDPGATLGDVVPFP